jgi:hypothetical protein
VADAAFARDTLFRMSPILAAISGGAVVNVIVTLVIVALIYMVADWALKKFALPPPFDKVAMVLLVLLAAAFIINALMGLTSSGPFIKWGS